MPNCRTTEVRPFTASLRASLKLSVARTMLALVLFVIKVDQGARLR